VDALPPSASLPPALPAEPLLASPIATWITPCNSCKVQVSGTSTRRHTIGLIPSSHTLTCMTPAASGTGGAGPQSAPDRGYFESRGTSQLYRACPYSVPGTTHFLMVPIHKRGLPHGSGLGKHRWPVERSLSWLLENKRLGLRYDRCGFIVQSLLQTGCIFLLAHRLAREF